MQLEYHNYTFKSEISCPFKRQRSLFQATRMISFEWPVLNGNKQVKGATYIIKKQ